MKARSKYLACCCALCVFLGAAVASSAQTVGTSRTRIPQDGAAVALNNLQAKAQAAMDRKDYAAAVTDYQEYLAKKPDDATVHYHLGLAYQKANQPSQARQQMERVLKISPNNSDARKALSELRG